tara:strand:- start:457 stop:573 length:117 start_codon:yes stop_codon:yes gene_type:complete
MQAGIYVAKDFFFGIELRIGEEPLTLKGPRVQDPGRVL